MEAQLIDYELTNSFDDEDYTEDGLPASAFCPDCGSKLRQETEVDYDVHQIFTTVTCPGCGYTATDR